MVQLSLFVKISIKDQNFSWQFLSVMVPWDQICCQVLPDKRWRGSERTKRRRQRPPARWPHDGGKSAGMQGVGSSDRNHHRRNYFSTHYGLAGFVSWFSTWNVGNRHWVVCSLWLRPAGSVLIVLIVLLRPLGLIWNFSELGRGKTPEMNDGRWEFIPKCKWEENEYLQPFFIHQKWG